MVKTICIPEEIHKKLVNLKLDYENKNIAELIDRLICEHKERRFLESSVKFKEMLKEEGISFDEFLKDAKKIREEVADELFPEN